MVFYLPGKRWLNLCIIFGICGSIILIVFGILSLPLDPTIFTRILTILGLLWLLSTVGTLYFVIKRAPIVKEPGKRTQNVFTGINFILVIFACGSITFGLSSIVYLHRTFFEQLPIWYYYIACIGLLWVLSSAFIYWRMHVAHERLKVELTKVVKTVRRKKQLLREPVPTYTIKKEDKVMRLPLLLFKPTFSYLIKEEKPDTCFRMLSKFSARPVLCITTIYPPKLKQLYRLHPEVQCFWLTEISEAEGVRTLHPSKLEFEILLTLISFLDEYRTAKPIILLEGLELLFLKNDYTRVVGFLKDLSDAISKYEGTLVVSLNPDVFIPRELAMLEKLFDFTITV